MVNNNGNGRYLTWKSYTYATAGVISALVVVLLSLFSLHVDRPHVGSVTAAELVGPAKEREKLSSKMDEIKKDVEELAKNQAVIKSMLDNINKKL